MDPVTHLTAGALQGHAFRPILRSRWVFLFCLLASWLPDIDNLVGFTNPELYLIHHRGITHSFLGALFLSLFLSLIFRLFCSSFPFWRGSMVAFVGILVHIFLDLITTYGTQIFSPLSRTRYAIPSVFIIDPLFTLTLIVLLVVSFLRKRARRTVVALGLAWIFIYPMVNFGFREALELKLEKRLSYEGRTYSKVHVSPDALTPLYWKVILETDSTYEMTNLSLLHPKKPMTFQAFQKADRALMERLGQKESFFRTYAWFAEFPTMKRIGGSGRRAIVFSDLRFYSSLDFVNQRFRRSEEAPFSLTAVFNDGGELVQYTYLRPGSEVFIEYIE
jgi:inner membrane protein